jgi:hypothetical protein
MSGIDLKRFGTSLDLIEMRLVDLERQPDRLALATTDYQLATAMYNMMSVAEKARVQARVTAIQQRLAVLALADQKAGERLALLETFFTKVATVTQCHHTDKNDHAWVSPRVLGELLSKVDPHWFERKTT